MVGGGDTALEEATFLTKFASKVTIVHRRDALRASKIMQEKAARNPKIAYAWNSVVEEIVGKNEGGRKTVTGVRLKNVKTGESSVMKTDGVFMGIGHQPHTSLFTGQLERYVGYLIKREDTQTNVRVVCCRNVRTVCTGRRSQRVRACGALERTVAGEPAWMNRLSE